MDAAPSRALKLLVSAGILALPLLTSACITPIEPPPLYKKAPPNPVLPSSAQCPASAPNAVWTDESKTAIALCGATVPNSDTSKKETSKSAPLVSFLGIPYTAAPPTPPNRWRPSEPASWPPSPAVAAVNIQSQCMQKLESWDQPPTDEDCLYLNIWAPSDKLNSPSPDLPVMVFIHGGAFVAGSGGMPVYDGAALARKGVIVVTLNYRLGAFGFMAAKVEPGPAKNNQTPRPPIDINGNFGLIDQRNAMTWVQRNIARFGGDPQKITLFGESAGAMSTGIHLFSSPASSSLFRAAIMESNPVGSLYRTLEQAQAQGGNFITSLCQRFDNNASCDGNMEWLQSVSPEKIQAAQNGFRNIQVPDGRNQVPDTSVLNDSLTWAPNVDGTQVVAQPLAGYAQGMPVKPFMFGTNANEGALFAAKIASSIPGGHFDKLEYELVLANVIRSKEIRQQIITYKNTAGQTPYFPPAPPPPPSYYGKNTVTNSTAQTTYSLINDFAFHCANLSMADQAALTTAIFSPNTPIYGYWFSQPPVFDIYRTSPTDYVEACLPGSGNVCHGNELPYVFGTLDALPGMTPAPDDRKLETAMTTVWTDFAKNPTAVQGLEPYNQDPKKKTGKVLNVFNVSVEAVKRRMPVSDLNTAANCSLWNKVGVYPQAAIGIEETKTRKH
ncbi:carboxylesterase type B [Azospirillum sp. B510]|uniref:carboxylesterase family protein n=1 Tax=Azospirillum sp. (strain B510) TaxID=137722 RepID=UPI0001C4BEB2|nr:carboxylesterase family protein [Azospirillum sp. B510]BAI71733.1 carboxylesterase type B [Azospirillum sp. B510]